MARLYRFVKLGDRFDTQIFTFVLPNKLLREYTPEVYGKDFVYGFQKWNVNFSKSDVHLGAHLKLITASPGMNVNVDFSFTILNKEHFTRNESFSEKGCAFNVEKNTSGRQTFIALGDLVNRNFMQENGEFLIELELRSCLSTFQCYLRMAKDHQSRYSYGPRLESPYFSFGLFDWSVSLFPNASTMEADGNVAIQLHRHTSFDHLCSVRYDVTLGENGLFESGELEQLLDLTGNGDPYIVGSSLNYLARGRAAIKVVVSMYSVVSVSEATLHVLNRNRNRAHCYDRDKQAWMLEADTSNKCLSFRLYYTDISHVPRRYTRYVCWSLNVIPRPISERPLKAVNSPYYKYYVQQDLDEGFEVQTDILVDEVCISYQKELYTILVHCSL